MERARSKQPHDHDEPSKAEANPQIVPQLPLTGDFPSEELCGKSSDMSLHITRWNSFASASEGVLEPSVVTETIEGCARVPTHHECIEPELLTNEKDIFLTFDLEHVMNPGALTAASTFSPIIKPGKPLCATSAARIDSAADQILNYPQGRGESSEDQFDSSPALYIAEKGQRTAEVSEALHHEIEIPMDWGAPIKLAPSEPILARPAFDIETFQASQGLDVDKVRPESEVNLEVEETNPQSRRRQSGTHTLGSLKNRLSYSSSQMSDIITAFKRFSLSSKGTISSSGSSNSFGHLDELSQERPREVSLETLYSTDYPLELPGKFIKLGIKMTNVKPCDCLLLRGNYCGRCLKALSFNNFIIEYQKSGLPVANPASLEIGPQDRFNNTALHLAAAIGAPYSSLETLMNRGARLNNVNTAGQTFLHVMDLGKSIKSQEEIPAILSQLSQSGFDFAKVDHQGMNVLQVLLQYPLQPSTIEHMFEVLNPHLSSLVGSRDNLGRTVQSRLLYLAQNSLKNEPERTKCISTILQKIVDAGCLDLSGNFTFDRVPRPISEEDHSLLEGLVKRALRQPFVEDYYGRNGLHCLAEASLKQSSMSFRHIRDHQRRQAYFVELIKVGVPVNAYDKAGNTPLLAFIHSSRIHADGNSNGQAKFYLSELVKAGANVNARNRDGASALHVAVKCGLPAATQVLIKAGANLHARQRDGKGVVKVGLEAADTSRTRKSLHIRIITCVNMVRERGAVDDPTVVQEWKASQTRDDPSPQAITLDTYDSFTPDRPLGGNAEHT